MAGLFLRDSIHSMCNRVDLSCGFSDVADVAQELVRKNCNDFLKTKQGFHYLTMKYPNLSVPQAIDEYVKNALWIDSIA